MIQKREQLQPFSYPPLRFAFNTMRKKNWIFIQCVQCQSQTHHQFCWRPHSRVSPVCTLSVPCTSWPDSYMWSSSEHQKPEGERRGRESADQTSVHGLLHETILILKRNTLTWEVHLNKKAIQMYKEGPSDESFNWQTDSLVSRSVWVITQKQSIHFLTFVNTLGSLVILISCGCILPWCMHELCGSMRDACSEISPDQQCPRNLWISTHTKKTWQLI